MALTRAFTRYSVGPPPCRHRLPRAPGSSPSSWQEPACRAPTPGRRAYVYGYSRSERLPSDLTIETTNKVLTIAFDDHDVVVEYSLVITSISKPLRPAPNARHTPDGGRP